MPAYTYDALDANGKARSGVLEAENAKAARQQLRGRELVPLAVLPVAAAVRADGSVRRGHPLSKRRSGLSFDDLLPYPIASTPLSDEVARVLVERYGARAHPSQFVTLRCEEIPSLVEVARQSDAVLLAIRASAPDLVKLTLRPPLDATARFGLVTLRRRTLPPGLATVRALMARWLIDQPA